MNYKQFRKIRILIAAFVSTTVVVAINVNSVLLAISGVLIGMVFIAVVKKKTDDVLVDERVINVAGHAGRITYAISTIVIALLALVFIIDEDRRRLGEILNYVVLFNVAIYYVSYKYYIKKYGDEK